MATVKKKSAKEDEPSWLARLLRDLIIFLVGIAGVINEGFLKDGPSDPWRIALFGAMIGLPGFLHLDEWLRK